MDKNQLYKFSVELRELLEDCRTIDVVSRIEQAGLSEKELEFLFMCLQSNGYDPKTDSFLLYESDNSAFLELVNKVQDKVNKNK